MSKVQKQLLLVEALSAYVMCCKTNTSSISAISKYFRVWLGVTILSRPEQYLNKLFISAVNPMFWLWLGVTVHMLRHLHAQYCPFQSHHHNHLIPFPPVVYFRFLHATHPLLRGVQTRKTSVCRVGPYTRQRLCGTAPFQPTACICIFLCTNSIVLQALRERYNAYRGKFVALYLPCPCLCVSLQNSKLYSLVNHIYVIVTLG